MLVPLLLATKEYEMENKSSGERDGEREEEGVQKEGGGGREREGERTKPWSCTLSSFIQSCLKPVYLGLFC